MASPPAVILSAVHEGYLIALIALSLLQFWFFRKRLSALQNKISHSEREQRALQREVVQLQEDRESMELEANYDTLTGLPNRRSFAETLDAALDDAQARQHHCALLMIDFDRFKSVNDRFGHQAGDVVLKSLAANLQESLSHGDRMSRASCARYGGDEFSVILPGFGSDEASRFAEDLRMGIESLNLEFEGRRCPITISIGVAAFPVHTDEPKSLLELADRALYRAKAAGRNRVCRPSGQSDIVVER